MVVVVFRTLSSNANPTPDRNGLWFLATSRQPNAFSRSPTCIRASSISWELLLTIMPVLRALCTISRHPVRQDVSALHTSDAEPFNLSIRNIILALINPDHSNPVSHMGEGPFFANYKVLVPVSLSIIAIGSFIGIVILIRKRKLTNQNRLPSASISESPSTANLQNKQNRDQQYQVVRCQSNRNSHSNDSGSFKAEGNGE